MLLELHQIEERYRHLRVVEPDRVARMVGELGQGEQRSPVLVVPTENGSRFVLIDGYHRVAALRRLHRDTVEALLLPCSEIEALVLGHRMEHARGRSALEEAWLLRELMEHHGVNQEDLARDLHRSASWVSRRLALLRVVSEPLAAKLRSGQVPTYAATKYLVPLARANRADAQTLVENLGSGAWSVRQIARVYEAWKAARPGRRAEIVANPRQAAAIAEELEKSDPLTDPDVALASELVKDLRILSAVSGRARPKLACLPTSKSRVEPALVRTRHDLDLFVRELEAHLGEEESHGAAARH